MKKITVTEEQIRKYLNQIEQKLDQWKSREMEAASYYIARHARKNPVFWPDEIFFEAILKNSDSCIGITYRILSKWGAITKTGLYRTSERESRRGSMVFQYIVTSEEIINMIVRKYEEKNPLYQFHPELALWS